MAHNGMYRGAYVPLSFAVGLDTKAATASVASEFNMETTFEEEFSKKLMFCVGVISYDGTDLRQTAQCGGSLRSDARSQDSKVDPAVLLAASKTVVITSGNAANRCYMLVGCGRSEYTFRTHKIQQLKLGVPLDGNELRRQGLVNCEVDRTYTVRV
jgi:hypothetical protein